MNTRPALPRSWRRAALGAARAAALVSSVCASSGDATTLFALVDTGELFESTDGIGWSVRSALPVRDAAGLVAVSSSADLLLASESGTLYRSSDGGVSWSAAATVPASDVRAICAAGSGTVFLVTSSGTVFRDAGTGPVATSTVPASNLTSITRLGIDTFALAETGEVHRSSDDGATWSVAGIVPYSNAVAIAALGGTLYTLASEGAIAESTDLGSTWIAVGTLSQVGMTSLLASADRLYSSAGTGEVGSSFDGTEWSWQGSIGQLTVRSLAHDSPALGLDAVETVPRPIEFLPPRPNPTAGAVHFTLELLRSAEVTIEIFDVRGRLVDRPVDHLRLPIGPAALRWQPGGIAPGTYFVRARIGTTRETQRLVIAGTTLGDLQ